MIAKRVLILFSALVTLWGLSLARSDESPPPNTPCGPDLELPDCTPTETCDVHADTRNCQACMLHNPFGGCAVRGNDPSCEAAKAAQNAGYDQSKAACEASKSAQKAQCEAAKESIRELNARRRAACAAVPPAPAK